MASNETTDILKKTEENPVPETGSTSLSVEGSTADICLSKAASVPQNVMKSKTRVYLRSLPNIIGSSTFDTETGGSRRFTDAALANASSRIWQEPRTISQNSSLKQHEGEKSKSRNFLRSLPNIIQNHLSSTFNAENKGPRRFSDGVLAKGSSLTRKTLCLNSSLKQQNKSAEAVRPDLNSIEPAFLHKLSVKQILKRIFSMKNSNLNSQPLEHAQPTYEVRDSFVCTKQYFH